MSLESSTTGYQDALGAQRSATWIPATPPRGTPRAQLGPEADALVFTSLRGTPLRNSHWHDRFWEPALRAAKLPLNLRIHDLRHTCASLLISEGVHVKAVQRHFGHSSPTVTLNTYMHLFPEDMERVADGLDRLHDESSDGHQTARGDRPFRRPRTGWRPRCHLSWGFGLRRAWDSNPQAVSGNGFQDRPLAN